MRRFIKKTCLLMLLLLALPAWADYAPPRMLQQEYQRYLERGQQATMSDPEIRALLAEFEAMLAQIYGTLGTQAGPALDKDTPTAAERDALADAAAQAGDKVAAATRKLLAPFGFSDSELTVLLPHYRHVNRLEKLLISALTPPKPTDLLDESTTYYSVPLNYFMAGLGRRVGVYIHGSADERIVGKELRISFPSFHVSSNGTDRDIPLRADIAGFLANPAMQDVTGKLYDPKITEFHETVLQSSNRYDLGGVAPYDSTYGENDIWESEGKILIYEANIQRRARKWRPEWTVAYRNAIEIHEMMHSLYRSQRAACSLKSATKAQALDESQAQIAALAVMAQSADPQTHLVLSMNMFLIGDGQQELVYDGFYKPLMRRILARTPSEGAPVDIDQLGIGGKVSILMEVTAKEIIETSHTALLNVIEREAAICR